MGIVASPGDGLTSQGPAAPPEGPLTLPTFQESAASWENAPCG